MTNIDRLRNEFVDAMARTYEDDIEGERWEDARDSIYLAARRLIEAIDKPQRTGWFTAYVYPPTEKDVRVCRELREDGIVYDERGYKVTHGLDGYVDIEWEDDERTYTEEEVRKAWIYSENVYSWKAFQRELRRKR